MGLGDDMIGYQIPGPAWFADPAVVVDVSCPLSAQFTSDPTADYDRRNEYHKLESESTGPDGGSLVASHLATLVGSFGGAPRTITPGRFVMSSGLFTRRGADGPVGMWLSSGVVVALSGVSSFGGVRVTYHGVFMDFDGRAQSGPDINTRGMLLYGKHGSVMRFFMDPYPAVSTAKLG